MSVKAGFSTAIKKLKCFSCKKVIEKGERYFEAKTPNKTIRTCVSCAKKHGLFSDEEVQIDVPKIVIEEKVLKNGAINKLKNTANKFDEWLKLRHPDDYDYTQKWRASALEKVKNPGYSGHIIKLMDEMIKEGY